MAETSGKGLFARTLAHWNRLFSHMRQERVWLVWLLAALIGVATGYAVLLFRTGIGAVQWLWLDIWQENIVASKASRTHPFIVFLGPVIGGAVVGLLLVWLAPHRRASGVADVIEAAHVRHGVIGWKDGLMSAVITMISLGAGASAGREGPAVHIGASVASQMFRPFRQLKVAQRRVLMAAGAAAAVAASFNAPIAGMLFAHEVILGHYALSAFVPTVLASVAGALIIRSHLGDQPAFRLPELTIHSHFEMPAFLLLGLLAGFVAVAFLRAVEAADLKARQIPMPLWLRPVAGGVIIGLMGMFVPEILGVGYEATSQALRGRYDLLFLLLLLGAKMLATAITLASRFGGGVFSPSLFLGAMTGGIVGHLVALVAPNAASDVGAYALVGTAAVAGGVLGAPLSTALIVFEMTRDYDITIALLLATSVSAVVMQVLAARSFFHWQLQQRGLDLASGPHRRIMRTMTVKAFMVPREKGASRTVPEPFDERPQLEPGDSLEKALRTFNRGNYSRLAVVDAKGRLVGWADYAKALEAYNDALVEAELEEHR
ncbi:chloride channel protein [Thermopetrobacter sp. TC1]|uniref:chloride channel protein n=1 Tax=Thermopetrobacter sp. TC1 TaxID=1495045 RepID=UPI000690F00A|nr:chloride channel protein [Thermopetrobacter sp. TC1]